MEVRPFRDEVADVAPLYGLSLDELTARTRDRWIAIDNGTVVAAAETLQRPDGRLFLSFRGEHYAADALAHSLASSIDRTVYTTVDDGSPLARQLIESGFAIEVTNERFVVQFDSALDVVRGSAPPARYRLVRASETDPNRLFALDNAIRNLVPGSDGWAGNRAWFDDELTDPAAYWVAIDRATDSHVGLARIWNNAAGPRFGLIGVLPAHRRPSPAPALLATVLEESSGWGSSTFTTDTAVSNRIVYPRLRRLGTPAGRFHQLVLDP